VFLCPCLVGRAVNRIESAVIHYITMPPSIHPHQKKKRISNVVVHPSHTPVIPVAWYTHASSCCCFPFSSIPLNECNNYFTTFFFKSTFTRIISPQSSAVCVQCKEVQLLLLLLLFQNNVCLVGWLAGNR
jgi:hypothetical protein